MRWVLLAWALGPGCLGCSCAAALLVGSLGWNPVYGVFPWWLEWIGRLVLILTLVSACLTLFLAASSLPARRSLEYRALAGWWLAVCGGTVISGAFPTLALSLLCAGAAAAAVPPIGLWLRMSRHRRTASLQPDSGS